MKRFFIVFITLLFLAATLTITTGAAEVTSKFYNVADFHRLYDVTSGSSSEWTSNKFTGNNTTLTGNVQTFIMPAKYMFNFGTVEYNTENFILFHTYHFEYTYTLIAMNPDDLNGLNFILSTIRLLNYSKLNSFLKDPMNNTYSTPIDSLFTSSNVFVHSDGSDTITLDIILHVDNDIGQVFNCISPILMLYNSSGSQISGKVELTNLTIYDDFAQESYDNLTYELSKEIKASIDDGFNQVHNDLAAVEGAMNQVNSTLKDDPDFSSPDLSQQFGDMDRLEQTEDEIFQTIYQPVNIGDQQFQVSPNMLSDVGNWISERFMAPDYDTSVGKEISDIFELFMPYLGAAIYLSLTLGLIIAFLTGKRMYND